MASWKVWTPLLQLVGSDLHWSFPSSDTEIRQHITHTHTHKYTEGNRHVSYKNRVRERMKSQSDGTPRCLTRY